MRAPVLPRLHGPATVNLPGRTRLPAARSQPGPRPPGALWAQRPLVLPAVSAHAVAALRRRPFSDGCVSRDHDRERRPDVARTLARLRDQPLPTATPRVAHRCRARSARPTDVSDLARDEREPRLPAV